MARLKHPSILIDLGHVGKNGLPYNAEARVQQELQLCREWGFQLNVADNRVSLVYDQEQLVPYWIQQETPAIAWDWLRVSGYLSVESTNTVALEMARQNAPGGALVYAELQTAGKGRKDRTWFSPPGAGLYFTLILRPAQEHKFWPLLTHVASVALGETLRNLSERNLTPHPLQIDIKWPNDVLLSGKKCAGILLETIQTDNERHAAVVGVGINVHRGSFPEALSAEATCIDEMADALVPRRLLLVRFLDCFQRYYLMFEQGRHADILERWKSMSSMWSGTRIWISDGQEPRHVETCGLNEAGALLVRSEDGVVETILAGDISVRRDS
jgi:BirA family transcriptional regulator, biotin operon repressor / biotin---[acetyl-CoA-carboxylase] ligase